MSWWIFLAAGWALAVCWLVAGFLPIYFYRKKRFDSCTAALTDPERWPLVSVVVAARNEASLIEKSLRSLAAMDYPNFEVVAVNDRSVDGTGDIIDRVAAGGSRIRALHIKELPAGWLGKCHALHCGSRHASGGLLLFTDADVTFSVDTLRLAVRYFEAHRN